MTPASEVVTLKWCHPSPWRATEDTSGNVVRGRWIRAHGEAVQSAVVRRQGQRPVGNPRPKAYPGTDVDIDLRALAPLIVLAVALALYALVDLVRAPAVRYLPKWAWALICVLSLPLGPLAYLTLGRAPR